MDDTIPVSTDATPGRVASPPIRSHDHDPSASRRFDASGPACSRVGPVLTRT